MKDFESYNSINERFKDVVSHFGNNTAIHFNDKTLTYSELDHASNLLAICLLETFKNKKERIAIYLNPGPNQIIAILAVIKSGLIYVPLDINFPNERNKYMLNDTKCSGIIYEGTVTDRLTSIAEGTTLVNIKDQPASIDHNNLLGVNIKAEDPMLIVYTSGTSGEPKGFIKNHRSTLHFVDVTTELGTISDKDNIAFFYSICFSAHIMLVFSSLLNGSELSIFDFKKENAALFPKWFKERNITVSLMIPSILRQFALTIEKKEKVKSMRVLFCGGETLYKSDIDKIRPAFKRSTTIYNIYASTEANLCMSYEISYETIIKSNTVPVGFPVRGYAISLVAEEGNESKTNIQGTIVISSEYLAVGYNSKSENNKQEPLYYSNSNKQLSFKSSDIGYFESDGSLVHIGRKDNLIKLNGYRIDTGEIENYFNKNSDIIESAVAVKKSPKGKSYLVGYIVHSGVNATIEGNYLKVRMQRKLPDYMIPSYIVELDSLPKNAIGKVNKNELPEPDWLASELNRVILPPINETQRIVVKIFKKCLEIDELSIDDNILKVGADSIRMFVAFDELEKVMGKKLDIDLVFKNPTVENIALLLDK